MRHQRLELSVAMAVVLAVGSARADVFNLPTGQTSLEFVTVGNPGNMADTRYPEVYYGISGYGAVDYIYQIGKYEVTDAQYCEFLNFKAKSDLYGLYNTAMGSNAIGGITRSGNSPNYSYAVKPGYENKPVAYVSFWDLARFTNWLHNGQGSGDTETGAYTLNGFNGNDGRTIVRNAGAKYWLPSEDEWYKAAYHKNDGTTGNYWGYATGADAMPYSDNPAALALPTNSANYWSDDGITNGYNDGGAIGPPGYLADVGAYSQSPSPYGTFDQNGNVWEWNEARLGASRGIRGGSFASSYDCLYVSWRDGGYFAKGEDYIGIRVASVPEPSSLSMLAGIVLTALLCWWRKRA